MRLLDKIGRDLYKQLRQSVKGEDSLLVAYCEAYSLFVRATKTIQEQGLTLTLPNGITQVHPCCKIQKQATSAMNQLAMRLGLDAKKHTPLETNKWSDLIQDVELR